MGKPVPLDGFGIAAADDARSLTGRQRSISGSCRGEEQPLPVSRLNGHLPEGKWIVVAPCTARSTRGRDTAAGSDVCQARALRGMRSSRLETKNDLKLLLVGSDSAWARYTPPLPAAVDR